MFNLDSRLADDCVVLGDLDLCRVLLNKDCLYPWLILVPMREGITEIFQLKAADQQLLWQESTAISELMYTYFKADKMNIAALGNLVPQLHLHHVARYKTDKAWPGPIWGVQPAVHYSAIELQQQQEILQNTLANKLKRFKSA